MTTVAIITARGGSKRIPGKNIKEFCGKPIIAYSLEAALNCKEFDEVMVSTDSPEIAAVAREYGAAVPFMRSQETSNDYATTVDVIKEVLTEYKKIGKSFDQYCVLYATAPFVTSNKLEKAFEILKINKADFLTPVVKIEEPVFRSFYIDEKQKLKKRWPEYQNVRTQDLPTLYLDCGQFYIGDAKKVFYVPYEERNMVAMIIPSEEEQDIDTIEDWEIAERKFRKMISK